MHGRGAVVINQPGPGSRGDRRDQPAECQAELMAPGAHGTLAVEQVSSRTLTARADFATPTPVRTSNSISQRAKMSHCTSPCRLPLSPVWCSESSGLRLPISLRCVKPPDPTLFGLRVFSFRAAGLGDTARGRGALERGNHAAQAFRT